MVCMALLAYVFYRYDAASIFMRLQQVRVHWLVVAWALSFLAAPMVSSLKWKLILHSYGRRDSLLRLWSLYVEGGFFNLFFPGFVAGDVSRVARTSRDSRFPIEALMAVFLERFSGMLVALLFVGSIALLGGYAALGGAGRVVIPLAVTLALAMLLILLKVRWVRPASRVLPGFVVRRLHWCSLAGVHPAVRAYCLLCGLVARISSPSPCAGDLRSPHSPTQ
jgi:hypothetical protein